MDRIKAQVLATFIIWISFVLIMIYGRYPNVQEGNAVFLSAVMIFGVVLATTAVWAFPARQGAVEEAAKAKRRSRIERMLDEMSEQDLEELRARLMDADGELADMDELFHSIQSQR